MRKNANFSLTVFRKKTFKYLANLAPGNAIRVFFLKKSGYQIGDQVYIGEGLIIVDNLKNPNSCLKIGHRASISPRVTLILRSRPNSSKIADYVGSRDGCITIGDDCWIGTGAVILPGITLGEGSGVGANGVVTEDVPPYTIVGGVPAKKIKKVIVPWNK
jgi:acetyltransferase-like isoleucine patch superfamily enzyme